MLISSAHLSDLWCPSRAPKSGSYRRDSYHPNLVSVSRVFASQRRF